MACRQFLLRGYSSWKQDKWVLHDFPVAEPWKEPPPSHMLQCLQGSGHFSYPALWKTHLPKHSCWLVTIIIAVKIGACWTAEELPFSLLADESSAWRFKTEGTVRLLTYQQCLCMHHLTESIWLAVASIFSSFSFCPSFLLGQLSPLWSCPSSQTVISLLRQLSFLSAALAFLQVKSKNFADRKNWVLIKVCY